MKCNPTFGGGQKYIIMVIDYFTKWAKAMPTYNNMDDTTTRLCFNHVITFFGVPKKLVFYHGKTLGMMSSKSWLHTWVSHMNSFLYMTEKDETLREYKIVDRVLKLQTIMY
jgi:hypothetical protein